MADGVFTLELVAPEEKLLETPAKSVTLRSSDGDLTVLDGHTPLVTDIVPGEVKVELEDGEFVRFAVHGGFLQVGRAGDGDGNDGTLVTLIAGVAEAADKIDGARAEQARAAASARVEELSAAIGRGPGGAGAASTPAGGGAGGEGVEHVLTPEELELVRAQAALERAEVRLAVAGATVS
jgi:F-type H+-transporting ATPase subunit epsilon